MSGNFNPADKFRALEEAQKGKETTYDKILKEKNDEVAAANPYNASEPSPSKEDFRNRLHSEGNEIRNTLKDIWHRTDTSSADRALVKEIYADPELRNMVSPEEWDKIYDPKSGMLVSGGNDVKNFLSGLKQKATEIQAAQTSRDTDIKHMDKYYGDGSTHYTQDNELNQFVGHATQDPEVMKMLNSMYKNKEITHDPSHIMMKSNDFSKYEGMSPEELKIFNLTPEMLDKMKAEGVHKYMNFSPEATEKMRGQMIEGILGDKRYHDYFTKHKGILEKAVPDFKMNEVFQPVKGVDSYDLTKSYMQYLKNHPDAARDLHANSSLRRLFPIADLDRDTYNEVSKLYQAGNVSKIRDMGIDPMDFEKYLKMNPAVYSTMSDAEMEKVRNTVDGFEKEHRFDAIKDFGRNMRDGIDDTGRSVNNMLLGLKDRVSKMEAPKFEPPHGADKVVERVAPQVVEKATNPASEAVSNIHMPHFEAPDVDVGPLAGAGAGGALGGIVGHNMDHKNEEERANNRIMGAATGAGLGGMASLLANSLMKHSEAEEITKEAFERDRGSVLPVTGHEVNRFMNGDNEHFTELQRYNPSDAYENIMQNPKDPQAASSLPNTLEEYGKTVKDPTHGGANIKQWDTNTYGYTPRYEVAPQSTSPVNHGNIAHYKNVVQHKAEPKHELYRDGATGEMGPYRKGMEPTQDNGAQDWLNQHYPPFLAASNIHGNEPIGHAMNTTETVANRVASNTTPVAPTESYTPTVTVPGVGEVVKASPGGHVVNGSNALGAKAMNNVSEGFNNVSSEIGDTLGLGSLGALAGFTGGSLMGGDTEVERRNNRNRGLILGTAGLPLGNLAIKHLIDSGVNNA